MKNMLLAYTSLTSATSQTLDVPWTEIVTMLQEAASVECVKKERLPLFAFADFGGRRKDSDVQALSAVVVDCDHLDSTERTRALEWASQFRCAYYTTHSCGLMPDEWSFRLIFPLAENWTGSPSAYKSAVKALLKSAKIVWDQSTCNLGRWFFIPSTNPVAIHSCEVDAWEGPCLELPSVLDFSELDAETDAETDLDQSTPVNIEQLFKLANGLKKQGTSMAYRETGSELLRLCKGERACEPGKRGGGQPGGRGMAIYQIAARIAQEWPTGNAVSIGEALRQGLEHTDHLESDRSKGSDPVADFVRRLRELQAKYQAQARADAAERNRLGLGSRQIVLSSESPPQPVLPLCVHSPTGLYWIRLASTSDEYTVALSKTAAQSEILARWSALGEDLDLLRSDFPAFLSRYSVLCSDYAYDYRVTRVSYDPARDGTIIMPAGIPQPISEARHAWVESWLSTLCGDGYAALCDWLSGLLLRNLPAPALYLYGPAQSGKSTLLDAISAIWKEQVTDATATHQFNIGLTKSPLIRVSERFYEQLDLDSFKDLVSRKEHKVTQKGRDTAQLRGHIRIAIEANGFTLPKKIEANGDDVEAARDRLLVINTRPAGHHLVCVSAEDRNRQLRQIAEHALWLASQHDGVPRGRWACSPGVYGAEINIADAIASEADRDRHELALQTAELLLRTIKGCGKPGHPMSVWGPGTPVVPAGIRFVIADLILYWAENGLTRDTTRTARARRQILLSLTERHVLKVDGVPSSRRRVVGSRLDALLDPGQWAASETAEIQRSSKTRN